MSDKYYRGLRNIINDTKYKLQLASMTLKINENKNNISGIKNDISEINNFSDKINDNTSSISTNSGRIITNKSAISINSDQINKNKNDISTNSDQISINTSSISTNFEKIDNFTQYILQSGKDFEEKYIIEKQIFRFNKDKHFYTIFEKEIKYNFTKNSLLFVKNHMYYRYENLSNDYHRLQHEYNIYDGDILIHKYLFNKDTYYDESPILHTNEDFCICFKNNYKKIKINLQLHRHNRHGAGNINLEINDDSENYINIDYVDRNNEGRIDMNKKDISTNSGKINTNKNNISSNLININSNEDNIAYNLNEINYLKNNKSTQYLKNIYNILIYDSKTQIDFREDIFYEKVFDVNANQNDFVEIFFKIQLEYRDTDNRHYVKSIYELFDENNNSLYVKSVNNNEYLYFSNKMSIDENIFYNFTNNIKKLKFVIKFQKLLSNRVIYLYYMKNDNYRLILKHFGN